MDIAGTTEEIYQRRADHFSAVEKRYAARERTVMRLRVAAFLVAVMTFIFGRNSPSGLAWYVAGGAALGGFVAAVVYHEHVRRQIQRYGLLRRINQQALARVHRDWTALPETSVSRAAPTSGRGRRPRFVRPRLALSDAVRGQHADRRSRPCATGFWNGHRSKRSSGDSRR